MKSILFLMLISTSIYSKDYLPKQQEFYSEINKPYLCKEADIVHIFTEDRSAWSKDSLLQFMNDSASSVLPFNNWKFTFSVTEQGYVAEGNGWNKVFFNKNGDILTFIEDEDINWIYYSSCLKK